VHYNPCGKVVEYGRRPYSTQCRFFSDSDEEVRIRWYPALPDAGTLPFPSKITSLDWSSWPWLASGVGEVFKASRGPTLLGDRPYNGAQAIPYMHGIDPCKGSEVFKNGEPYDPSAPPQLYDENLIPLCCINFITPAGGIEWDGTAPVSYSPPNNTCPTAILMDPSNSFSVTIPAGEERWYKVNIATAGTAYHWHMTVTPFSFGFIQMAEPNGTNCGDLVGTGLFNVLTSPADINFVTVAGKMDWTRIVNSSGVTVLWTGQLLVP